MPEKEKKSLKEYEGPDQVISSHEMEMALKEKPESILKLKSRIPGLDQATDGFREGELIIISGPTKNGKTLLAQSLTVAFAKQQEYPLWFSYEVPAKQFISQFKVLPLFYIPRELRAHVFSWLEERIRESFEKYHTRVVFIDHLHYLFDMARSKNASIDIGAVVRKLKNIAVSHNHLIFLLCHTTKGKSEDSLSYESIRDSSFISQESDCVLMVKRTPKISENSAQVSIEFHRRTGVLEKMISLEKIDGYLREKINRED